MAAPTIVRNELTPDTLAPGGTAVWITEAQDPDTSPAELTRIVRDSGGNTTTIVKALNILDVVSYDQPSCDDPRVTFHVDPDDPRQVTVTVAAS